MASIQYWLNGQKKIVRFSLMALPPESGTQAVEFTEKQLDELMELIPEIKSRFAEIPMSKKRAKKKTN